MKAAEYLKRQKESIIYSFTKNNKLSEEDALTIFNKCRDFINEVTAYRNNRDKTIDIIKENVKRGGDITNILIQDCVLKATSNDKTYTYAYTYLAQKYNREGGYTYYPVNPISEHELLDLLKEKKVPELTFVDLFINKKNAQKVKDILKERGYTKNGIWAANHDSHLEHTGNKTELLAVYYTLKNKGILKPGKNTPQAKTFYNEFGLEVGKYISERSLTDEPAPYHQEVFERIFDTIK